MLIREIRLEEKDRFNQAVKHPLQSWQWGEFRENTGVDVVRLGIFESDKLVDGFQITFHSIPKFPFTVGYIPKSIVPSNEVLGALYDVGLQRKALYIKFEPNLYARVNETHHLANFAKIEQDLLAHNCVRGRPLFTKYSFVMDLTHNEQELAALMKSKTRYNVSLAQKKGVTVCEDNSDKAFEKYLQLTFETTHRQGFYAHDKVYHQKMWTALKDTGIAHLLKADYNGQTLVTWIVFVFNNILYYPYGASSSSNRNVMASNLMMWEAMRFGKAQNCTLFDMWGSLGPKPDPHDSWIGFHRFKEGYGPDLVEFIGSFDLVIDPPKYQLYKLADNLRWKYLKLRAKLPF